MSVNDLLNSDVLLPAMGILFVVIMVFAIPAGLKMGKKTNEEIYGSNETGIKKEKDGVTVVARRTTPHPLNRAVMINMVVFELKDGTRIELAVQNPNTYGVLVEGDRGVLVYQGKKFIDFRRNRE